MNGEIEASATPEHLDGTFKASRSSTVHLYRRAWNAGRRALRWSLNSQFFVP